MMNDKPNNSGDLPLSILVVDDDALNQRMMLVILKREGHQVECVSNGLEAIQAVQSKPYDIVLMDLQMPVLDGIDASRQIREWESGKQHTYIVALTASYMPERGRELYEAGIDNYIAKPFDMEHLRNILQYGIENRKKKVSVSASKAQEETAAVKPSFDAQEGIKRVGGNREIFMSLLNDFMQELPRRMEKLWSFYKSKDMESLNRAAHSLKGIAANLGALQLSEYARRLEKQVSEGYNEQVEGLLNDIVLAVGQLKESVQNFQAGQQ